MKGTKNADKRIDQSVKRVTEVKERERNKGERGAERGSVMLDESCVYWTASTV